MDSQAFYRKWRPQSLADVVGQEQVTVTLLNALSSSRVSHAYLFCGPRGTGKTSTGRILSKAVNCLKNGSGEPCNECDMCLAITEGRAMDVIEIDAASNTGVDDIRSLREKVNYAPGQAKYKVYIIDEVHMLSNSASNALLKTLEEPPPNVIFVLATTEAHKVLPTIMSRCQRFDFRRVSQQDIMLKLDEICKAEGIKVETEAQRLVAKSSSGSLRDAENLLEQLFTFYGSEIGLNQVQDILGITGDQRVKELAACIIKSDISGGMRIINAVSSDGLDMKQFNRELVSYLRSLLLIKNGCDKELDLTAEEIKELKELATAASMGHILNAVKLFGQLEIGSNEYSTLPLELALVDCCLKPATVAPQPAKTVQQVEQQPAAVKPQPARVAQAAEQPPVIKPQPKKSMPKPAEVAEAKEEPAAEAEESKVSETPPPPASTPPAATIKVEASPAAGSVNALPDTNNKVEHLKANWKQVVDNAPESVKRTAAVAILRSAGVQPVDIDGDTIVLTFKYSYHKEKIEEPENLKITADIISRFIGKSCQVRCVYEAENNYLVKEAQRMGAQIIDVEDK